jgi:hypothetical protein
MIDAHCRSYAASASRTSGAPATLRNRSKYSSHARHLHPIRNQVVFFERSLGHPGLQYLHNRIQFGPDRLWPVFPAVPQWVRVGPLGSAQVLLISQARWSAFTLQRASAAWMLECSTDPKEGLHPTLRVAYMGLFTATVPCSWS